MLDCRRLIESAVFRWKSFLFKGNTADLSGWIRKGEHSAVKSCLFNKVAEQPQNKIFEKSFSYSEIGSLMSIEGMKNLNEYTDVFEIKLIPDMWSAFSDGGGQFQQDYCPCLSSKKVKTVFRKQKLNVLDWPGNSPDLTPWRIFDQLQNVGDKNYIAAPQPSS